MSDEIDAAWPECKVAFRENIPSPPAPRVAPRRPSPLQRGSRIDPFRAKDGYINIFGLNPLDKEPAND